MDFGFAAGSSFAHELDPRVRLISAVALSGVLAASLRPAALCFGLAASTLLVIASELDARRVGKRLLMLNGFLLLVWLTLPVATNGTPIATVGPFTIAREGVSHALTITLKANAIMMVCLALLATIDAVSLGHALHHVRVPHKLIHMLLFTVRYFDVMQNEYARLRDAMRIRCFRLRANRHTYRMIGYLAGMLLVNSLDRAECVLSAMKCRGFRGEFYVLRHFTLRRHDALFGGLAAWVLICIGYLEWTTPLLLSS